MKKNALFQQEGEPEAEAASQLVWEDAALLALLPDTPLGLDEDPSCQDLERRMLAMQQDQAALDQEQYASWQAYLACYSAQGNEQ